MPLVCRASAENRPINMKRSKLHQHIRDTASIARNARVLVAVSGGADSVALLHLLSDLTPETGWKLGVAHLNHQLRGPASQDDERLVRARAESLNIPCYVECVDVAARAKKSKQSVEMAARDARYTFLAGIAKQYAYDVIAVAHTKEDQAETLLLRLLRGAGTAGLGAMDPWVERLGVPLVRPLLDLSKADLIAYLQGRGVAWHEDTTNTDAAYLRNRVRHELMPLLRERFNPNITDTLARTAELVREDQAVLRQIADDDLRNCSDEKGDLDVSRLQALPVARRRRVILLWLIGHEVQAVDLDYDVIRRVEQLCATVRGTMETPVGGDRRVVRAYDRLTLDHGGRARKGGRAERYKLNVPGQTTVSSLGVRVVAAWGTGRSQPGDEQCGHLPAEAWISASAVGRAGLYLRSRVEGDRFAPLGLKGEKKIQDIFVDEKVPREQRDRVPLLECRGKLVWVPGYRVARGWGVGKASERSLHIRMERLETKQ